MHLYGFSLSGHSHRVALQLSLLEVPFDWVEVDLKKGEHKTPDFLAKNALGQVPVLVDGELTLAESNAILVYLALRYDRARRWLPADPVAAATVERWLSLAAGPLHRGLAALRLAALFGAPVDREHAVGIAKSYLGVLEAQRTPFLAGAEPTIADVANYTYVAHAEDGGFSLEAWPNTRAWLGRVEALPGFVRMS